jgi:hypothetical protein
LSGLCRSILATDSTVNDTITAALPGIFTLLGGLAGALIAWRIGRARETRNLRKDVYIGWLKAARFLGSWPSNQPTPTGGNIQVPHPAMKERINEATTELELVASRKVVDAANRYLEEIKSPGLATAMNQPGLKTFDDAVDRFQDYLKEARTEVVSAMRKDLGVAKG